jgi:5-methylcytosine-specific restriction endonuclease McrA
LECKKITSKAALERTRNDPERNQRRLEGLRSWRERNKAHVKAYAKQWSAKTPGLHSLKWRQKNPEKVIAYTAEYNRHNKDKKAILESHRRARKAASEGSYTPSDIADIRRMQKDKCAYCKVKLKGRGHIDHIIPLARGGTNYRSNLQLTCRSCNCRKHAKHPIEFAQREGRLL